MWGLSGKTPRYFMLLLIGTISPDIMFKKLVLHFGHTETDITGINNYGRGHC